MPGPVIQDADDGETAMIWTLEVEGEPPISVDYGAYASEVALDRALAAAMSGLGAAADSECDDDCPGGGTGGGDGGDDDGEVRYSPTSHHRFRLEHATEWPFSEEIEVTVGYANVSGTQRFEGIRPRRWYDGLGEILDVAPLAGGPSFYVTAVETDLIFDDHLGAKRFTAHSPQGIMSLGFWFSVDLSW